MTDRPQQTPIVGYPVRTRTPYLIRRGISTVETAVYLVVGLLLVLAAVPTVAGTLIEIWDALLGDGPFEPIPTGIVVLDRVLLVFIVAELLYTLRLVLYRGEILAEPFLFIGLIAAVRRVLVVTAEFERAGTGGEVLRNFLLELGTLALLAVSLATAIFLLRRSAGGSESLGAGMEERGTARRVDYSD